MRYGVSVKSETDSLSFESLNSFSKFLREEWKLSTSSIKEIVPPLKDVNEALKIKTTWEGKDWEIGFFAHVKKIAPLREKKFADANFTLLEIRMYSSLPRIIQLLSAEKQRVEETKKFMAESYEKFKGFAPKPENVRACEIEGLDESLSCLEDYYSNLERRLSKNKKALTD